MGQMDVTLGGISLSLHLAHERVLGWFSRAPLPTQGSESEGTAVPAHLEAPLAHLPRGREGEGCGTR